jgi:hypothetical protein
LAQLLEPRTAAARAHTHPLGITRSSAITAAKASEGAYGLRPQDLLGAYFPGEQPDAPVSEPQTIALVDAYNDPSAEADLKVYDEEFALPACTVGSSCFRQVNQKGETGNLPFPQSKQAKETREALCESKTAELTAREAACKEVEEADGWAAEVSVDIEVAHAVCQNCHIVLVEADNSENASLEAAENAAAHLGATEISNSWGGEEPLTDSEAFNHPGTVITAASGDNGYLNWNTSKEEEEKDGIKTGVNYPASSPHVVAVGGTRLSLSGPGQTWSSEKVWNGSGGGCSVSLAAQEWQRNVPDWPRLGCEGRRAVADVSADASPYTGVAVYDSVPYVRLGSGLKTARVLGWTPIGGTSVSSPIVASMFALAGGAHGVEYPAKTLYSHLGSASLHDVTEAGDGKCDDFYSSGCSGSMNPLSSSDCGKGVLICNPALGYDGPSGVGTPNGINALKPARQQKGGGPEAPITECSGQVSTEGRLHVCGTLNPHASAKAGYYFAYNEGTSCTGGKETPLEPEGQGEHIVVSSELFGLEPATQYTYCLVATDPSGETSGSGLTFTTEPTAPRAPETHLATSITSASATLRGSLGVEAIQTSWHFEYAAGYSCTSAGANTTPEVEDMTPGEPGDEVSAPVELRPGTEYTVCLVAENRVGATTGSEVWFTTDSIAPTVDAVSAQSTSTEATFEARISPNAQAATCEVQYGTSEAYGFKIPCTEGLGTGGDHVFGSAHVTSLKPSTIYHFQVIAENAIGKSLPSEGKGTVSTQPNRPRVTGESGSGATSTTAVVAGTIEPELTKTRYHFEYGETEAYGQNTTGGEVGASPGEVPISPETITGLNPGTTYYYRLRAVNTSGEAVGEAKTFTTPVSSPIVASVTPVVIPATAIMTTTTTNTATKTLAFSGLLLPRVQHRNSIVAWLTVERAGSRVEVDVTVRAGGAASAKKWGKPKPVVLARLVRASVGAGRLKLTVPLNATGKRMQKRHKHLAVTVKIIVVPPAGQLQTAAQTVTLKGR